MNSEQFSGLIRTLLAAGGPLASLLAVYGLPPDKITAWLAVALAVLPPVAAGIWSWASKRDAAQVARIEAMPGLKLLVTNTETAPAAAVKAAYDDNHPKVEFAPDAKKETENA